MSLIRKASGALLVCALALGAPPLVAQGDAQVAPAQRPGPTVRITGVVRDDANAITLPGVPVEVVGTQEIVYTDVDGRYLVQVPAGRHQLKVTVDGYVEKTLDVEAAERTVIANRSEERRVGKECRARW